MTSVALNQLWARAWAAWCALWTGECDPRPLAAYRIAWALSALFFTWKDRGRVNAFAEGRYHVGAFGELGVQSPELAELLLVVAAGGAVLVLLGLRARLGAALFVFAQGALFASDLLLFRNHAYLLLLTGALLAVSPAGAALSITRPSDAQRVPRWPSQLLKGQYLVVYFWAALNKLNPAFLDGWVLEGELSHYFPKSFAGALVAGPLHALEPAVTAALASSASMRALSIGVLVLEIALVVGLAVPRLRAWGVALGVLLHVTIAATMNVFVFGALMMASYILFLPPRGWRTSRVDAAVGSRPSRVPITSIEVNAGA